MGETDVGLCLCLCNNEQINNTEDNTLSKYEAVTKADHTIHCLI